MKRTGHVRLAKQWTITYKASELPSLLTCFIRWWARYLELPKLIYIFPTVDPISSKLAGRECSKSVTRDQNTYREPVFRSHACTLVTKFFKAKKLSGCLSSAKIKCLLFAELSSYWIHGTNTNTNTIPNLSFCKKPLTLHPNEILSQFSLLTIYCVLLPI